MMAKTWLVIMAAALLSSCSSPAPTSGFDQTAGDQLAHGKRLALALGCIGCHGEDLTGNDWSHEGFATMSSANLTQAAARYSPRQLENMIRSGLRPGGRVLWDMPSHLFTGLSEPDMKALLAYLYAQPKRGEVPAEPVFHGLARKEMAEGLYKSAEAEVREFGRTPAPDAGPSHERARYIVRATCAECHGVELRGGVPFPGAPFRPDLRMVASYGKADFERLLTSGMAAGNRELPMMSGVARGRSAHLTLQERDAIYAYLAALGKRDP